MYEFYCEYKTKSGHRCGETIFARDSIEAREIIPAFNSLVLFLNSKVSLSIPKFITSLSFN